MKLQNVAFKDLDGNPLRQAKHPSIPATPEDPIIYVASVLVNACLAAPANGQQHPNAVSVKRWALAIELHKALPDEYVEVPTDLIADLKNDVNRLYGVIVSGQFLSMLDEVK
jgi:hypothetical protein